MRLHIVCINPLTLAPCLVEMIGDIVEIEGMPANSCAVHALPGNGHGPTYAVSHIESGQRLAAADSIDSAIQMARLRVAATAPRTRNAGLKKAIALRHTLTRNPARQHLTAAPTPASTEANPSTKESA